MPNPKRQHSKQRGRKRRTHQGVVLPKMQPCSHCGKQVISHRVCPFCGHYKKNVVVTVEVKEKKTKE